MLSIRDNHQAIELIVKRLASKTAGKIESNEPKATFPLRDPANILSCFYFRILQSEVRARARGLLMRRHYRKIQ